MELATQALTHKPRQAYYWRLFATALSFCLFGIGGLCLRLLVFPLLSCLPGDASQHQRRARHTISCLFWFFIRLMKGLGILTYNIPLSFSFKLALIPCVTALWISVLFRSSSNAICFCLIAMACSILVVLSSRKLAIAVCSLIGGTNVLNEKKLSFEIVFLKPVYNGFILLPASKFK